ncbi:ATP-binding cassette domain-containing protein [Actinomadura sp. WAC 06369]|uniref:ATP-binding cassette domain-containing protein n=1 Tax=Actinomadura sp. WAC 06369 TaxID=2203193 RepID=UPI001F20AAE7|nr:ATP-binding cassette domain-containing protein [Actinomadura sp. WAC 06369]
MIRVTAVLVPRREVRMLPTAMSPTAGGLLVSGVTVRFGALTAVDRAALAAPAGAVTGLIGPDGAGKTTLCDVISGLRRPSEGTVRLGGADLTGGARERARRGVARTFERPGPLGGATVRDAVRTAAVRHAAAREQPGRTARDRWRRRRAARRDAAGRADELLARVGIGEYARRSARAVPPDVARLAELARALAADPSVLLLDEPWTGLPERRSRALEVLLRDLAADGLAVLVAGHDLEPVLGVCDVVHVLDGGRVVASGPPAEVRADARARGAYRGTRGPEARLPAG